MLWETGYDVGKNGLKPMAFHFGFVRDTIGQKS